MMSKKSFLFGFASILIWSTTFSLSKYVLKVNDSLNFNVFTYLALRLLFGLPYLWGSLIVTKKIKHVKPVLKAKWKPLVFLGLVSFAGAYIVQYFGILWTTSINQSIILNFQTFFVFFISAIIYKNKISPFIFVGAIVAFGGLFFIITNAPNSEAFSINLDTIWGDLMSLATAFLWATFSAVSAEIVREYDRLTILTLVETIGSVIIIPFAFVHLGTGFTNNLSVLNWQDWLALVWLGAICIGVGYQFWYEALADSPSQDTIILMYIMPIFSYFFGWIILQEPLNFWKTLIGTLLIIGGLLIAQFLQPKQNKLKKDEKIIE
jgi:drug/metabolite transporter (DMT)-like permease